MNIYPQKLDNFNFHPFHLTLPSSWTTDTSVSLLSLTSIGIDAPSFNTMLSNLILTLAIVCAVYTILSKNPIVSVLFLIGLYVNIAAYLIIIGSQFIGLSYILIYVGAISILFIFILMLINIRISELLGNTKNSISLILIIAILLNFVIYNYLSDTKIIYNFLKNENNFLFLDNYYVVNYIWDSLLIYSDTINTLGNMFYCHPIVFIEASIILLLAMIGAIVITIKPINENNKQLIVL